MGRCQGDTPVDILDLPLVSAPATGRKLAYGVEPSSRRYRLRLARYQALGEAVGQYLAGHLEEPRLDLLDVGVGSGRSRRYIEPQPAAERIRFVGVDSSDRRLASVYKQESWTLVKADVEAGLPFADASFDVALCEQVLEHLREPHRAVRETARVLRPGGLLVAGVPIFPPVVRWLRAHVVPAIDRLRAHERGHVQVFTLGSFRRLFVATGLFEIVESRGFRVISGGIVSFLEDHEWWWRLNRGLGRWLPALCVETQLLLRRVGGGDGARRCAPPEQEERPVVKRSDGPRVW
jgi:SAM-dependent methyltransferase